MDPWQTLEHTTLFTLALVAALSFWIGRGRRASSWVAVSAASLGAALFVWVGGVRVIAPSEVSWTFKFDWMWHYLGWHFFRHDAWHLPPGRMDNYLVPLSTSIGFTDAIPLVAFALKPLTAIAPAPFQYLGAWLCLCFALQGFFGARLVRLWTDDPVVQLLGALCFVAVPSLLNRVGHAALSSHWLLLWAIALYVEVDRAPARVPWRQAAALGALAGVIHPYLAAMMLALLGAAGLRGLFAVRDHGQGAWRGALLMVIPPTVAVVAGWWLSGLFLLTSVENLASEGLRRFSMNLLAVISPTGWSTLLPEQATATDGQAFEGFQYLGVGLIALLLLAALVTVARRGHRPTRWWPLALVAFVLAVYALSPTITMGARVLVELQVPWLERASMFRATGRFFWPATYVLVTAALAALITRLPRAAVVAVLAGVLLLQVVDVRDAYAARRTTRRDPSWFVFATPLVSPAWDAALPHYRMLALYPPPHCGTPPVPFEAAAFLAGRAGLAINGGLVARIDNVARLRSCQALSREVFETGLQPTAIYLLPPDLIAQVKAKAPAPIVCGVIDGAGVCVRRDSYEAWRSAAVLE